MAISAKRYALLLVAPDGVPSLLRKGVNNTKDGWSRHGLGHLLNPTDPEASDRDWTAAVWDGIIRQTFGLKITELPFTNSPAIGRTTVSSPGILKSLGSLNQGKPYSHQIKPSNFLLTCHVAPLGHPDGTDPEKFHLISPYDPDSRNWLKKEWINQYDGKRFRITTIGHCGTESSARVKTYGDVVTEYEFHPEAKCSDSSGNVCHRQTIGLLQRRHITIEQINTESNSSENVEAGLEHSEKYAIR